MDPLKTLKTQETRQSVRDIQKKTDTIVQDSPKYDLVFKSSIKKTPMSDMMTMGLLTEHKKILKKGTFNQNFRGMTTQESWKPSRRYWSS